MNTEEGCVKLWGSGHQAGFHLECKDGLSCLRNRARAAAHRATSDMIKNISSDDNPSVTADVP